MRQTKNWDYFAVPVLRPRAVPVPALGRDVATFRVCRLGEDEPGNLTDTDEIHEIHVDFADCFMPAMKIGRI